MVYSTAFKYLPNFMKSYCCTKFTRSKYKYNCTEKINDLESEINLSFYKL